MQSFKPMIFKVILRFSWVVRGMLCAAQTTFTFYQIQLKTQTGE